MNLYNRFYSQIRESAVTQFPSVKEVSDIAWDHLISPFTIELPKIILARVERAIGAFYGLSRGAKYQEQISCQSVIPFPVQNNAVLMAYDFHTTLSGEAYLVEINTNAAGFLLSALMRGVHLSQNVEALESVAKLKDSFLREGAHPGSKLVIADDDLPQQKMFLEFLMYRDIFKKWGFDAEIAEAGRLQFTERLMNGNSPVDFVYNRSTDFYFAELEHAALKEAWRTGAAVVSPQPKEYLLLADKERLVDFTRPGWLESAGATTDQCAAIREVLIPTYERSDFAGADELWSQRRGLFFKPRRAYGGKSVYRGESVSRKVFERLMNEDILIQKYVPASPVPGIAAGDPLQNWKFDLRFYVYRDEIQQVVARLYQGQVTNFASPLGGFTQVRFS